MAESSGLGVAMAGGVIEPTESENRRELDRFSDAMIPIRREIELIEQGTSDRENNGNYPAN